MKKEDYLNIVHNKIKNEKSKRILINQINLYYEILNKYKTSHNYEIGDDVFLKKGQLLHGTYKNIEGLEEIAKNGLISSWFVDGRSSKYPSSVGVWNLKRDYLLKNYINFYSGGTIMYCKIFDNDIATEQNKTEVVSYSDLINMSNIIKRFDCHMWTMEQTKEARFLPSLVQERVQIGIIYDSNNECIKKLLKGDILSLEINDEDVEEFINPGYYEKFIEQRKNKDDFFTDRESAILFGIPSNFIEGILVGREYEKNKSILNKIKMLLPNCYICNLDGKIIVK